MVGQGLPTHHSWCFSETRLLGVRGSSVFSPCGGIIESSQSLIESHLLQEASFAYAILQISFSYPHTLVSFHSAYYIYQGHKLMVIFPGGFAYVTRAGSVSAGMFCVLLIAGGQASVDSFC